MVPLASISVKPLNFETISAVANYNGVIVHTFTSKACSLFVSGELRVSLVTYNTDTRQLSNISLFQLQLLRLSFNTNLLLLSHIYAVTVQETAVSRFSNSLSKSSSDSIYSSLYPISI